MQQRYAGRPDFFVRPKLYTVAGLVPVHTSPARAIVFDPTLTWRICIPRDFLARIVEPDLKLGPAKSIVDAAQVSCWTLRVSSS